MLEFSKIKAELEGMKCPMHGQPAAIELNESGFHFSHVCCEHFQQQLDETLSDSMLKNVADISEELF